MKKIQFVLCALLSVFAASVALSGCDIAPSSDFKTPSYSSTGGNNDNEDPTPDDNDNQGDQGGNENDGNGDSNDNPASSVVLATFDFGAKGSASHNDGSEASSKSYSASGYTLSITNAQKTYFGAYDAKGNSCIKVGTGKAVGSFQFTVPSNVNSVEFHVARYKDTVSSVKINGTQFDLTKKSNDGAYDIITVDTSSSKSVSFSTVSGKLRAMIDSILFHSGAGGNGSQDGSENENPQPDTPAFGNHLYTDFTAQEKQLFTTYVGEVIPFLPNDEYYVEGWDYNNPTDYSDGLCFYTYDNTPAELAAYRQLYSAYDLTDSYEDTDGDTWYVYQKGSVTVELCGYELYDENYGTYYVVEVYASNSSLSNGESGGDVELLSNEGKGLPTGANGIHTVNFNNAKYVKTVADQGYYLDGCPTTGNVKVLVIPVQFSDVKASTKGYTINTIEKAFNGADGSNSYPSVSSYYQKSSYGKLNLTFDVMDEWFTPKNQSSYYLNATLDYSGQEVGCGDQIIIDEFLQAKNSTMDFAQYDSDNNSVIDAIVLINTLDINYDVTMQWAYRYWNLYTDSNDYYYEYDGVSANDYLWASYAFMFEEESGDFTDKSACNTYTYIHEFGHVLGADDYYDTSYKGSPMGGNDIMDSAFGDHNAYSKFNYGWITSSRVVTTDSSVTLSLEAFSKSGDTVIIANNWDDELGAYQEYFLLVYYTKEGLNSGNLGYFDETGIVVYHVNATLYKQVLDGQTYYDVYYNNTDVSDKEYGTEHNLIELVENGNGYVFGVGDKLSALYTDNGTALKYTFTVNSLSNGSASITVTKK